MVYRRRLELLPLEGCRPGQQLVQQHAKRIDIAAGIDVGSGSAIAPDGLFGAHVLECPCHLVEASHPRLIGPLEIERLGEPEVNHFGDGSVLFINRNENIGRLDVKMRDTLLVRVLNRVADRHEESEAVNDRQPVTIAVVGDRHPSHPLHHEIRLALFIGRGVQDPRDVGMVHGGQRLLLCPKARQHLGAGHPGSDPFQGNLTAERLLLQGQIDDSKSALAELHGESCRAPGECPADQRSAEDRRWGPSLSKPGSFTGNRIPKCTRWQWLLWRQQVRLAVRLRTRPRYRTWIELEHRACPGKATGGMTVKQMAVYHGDSSSQRFRHTI